MRKTKFEKGEHYHIHNVGVDNRNVFVSKEDYDRFEAYLYLLNDTESQRAANFFVGKRHETIFENARAEQLVGIGAYSLLPTHFHLILTPLQSDGIPKFMQKLTTAYTMYFNDKYQRRGSLFEGTYKARAATSENHLKYLLALTHLAPAQLFNKKWFEEPIFRLEKMAGSIMDYRYSGVDEYLSGIYKIITPQHFPRYFGRMKNMDTYLRYWDDNKEKYTL
jgi:putative transposase